MRDIFHAPAHMALTFLRVFGPMGLVVVLGCHLAAGQSSAYSDGQIWGGIGVGVALWLVAEVLHGLTGDDPDYVGNCDESPTWAWQIFSR